ncbi:MAG: hypothetical protein UIC64_07740, partial [Agathobacter sp.]|nr:hypothetical protein [Agathobacter sp.]
VYRLSGDRRIQVPYGADISNFDAVDYDYPEDIVTEMLNYYGHNRCKVYTMPRKVYSARAAVFHYEFPISGRSVDE